jgi:hypothetical protein
MLLMAQGSHHGSLRFFCTDKNWAMLSYISRLRYMNDFESQSGVIAGLEAAIHRRWTPGVKPAGDGRR